MKRRSILCCIVLCLLMILAAGCSGANKKSSSDVDETAFENVKGDYNVVETDTIGGWWHLYIGSNDDAPYDFSIYDVAAGNPGVRGEITSMTDSGLTIKIDADLFEQLPTDWKLSDDGSELTMEYTYDDHSITLTNNELPVVFERKADPE